MGDKPQLIFEVGTFGGILLMRFLISLLSNDLSIDRNPSLTLKRCAIVNQYYPLGFSTCQ
jgi:hypothetical protein